MFNFLKQQKILALAIFLTLAFSLFALISPNQIFAGGPCSDGRTCYNNKKCVDGQMTDEDCGSAILGGVEAPDSIAKLNSTSGIGILSFLSRLLNFGAIIGGIIVVGNFIGAGLMYISGAGNTDTHVKVRDRITYSVIGLLIIVSAYTIMGLMGLIFFKDATFLLNPRLQGVL